MAAMGLTTLIWNHILGKPMDWTVPLLAFIVLVAVGADYNILLMTRIREESGEASRRGVSRAVSATGGVITSAGLIFAGTFVAMATAPMLGLGETGTAVAIGLLLDTFIVRSMLVPAIAALLGPWNWWPSGRSLRHRHVADEDRDPPRTEPVFSA
jgi:RND superfamily putative drug exporter